MKFTLQDTKDRYRATLHKMVPEQLEQSEPRPQALAAGQAMPQTQAQSSWEMRPLGFYFREDLNRARFSVRDTLVPMLVEDNRQQDDGAIGRLLDAVALADTAGDTAEHIHDAYTGSQPKA